MQDNYLACATDDKISEKAISKLVKCEEVIFWWFSINQEIAITNGSNIFLD